jgi:Fanconi-associated nuclease 1
LRNIARWIMKHNICELVRGSQPSGVGVDCSCRYVRLFLRKTDAWFRIDKLQYQNDIADMNAACAALQCKDVGFADTDEAITLEELAGVLSLDELRVVAKDAKCSGSNKAQLLSAIKKASRAQGGLQTSGGQLQLSFDGRGNYVNREEHYIKKMLEKTGTRWSSMLPCFGFD